MQKINPTSRIWIRRILIIALFVVTESRYASGQCNWGFTTTIQPSVCAASGKITITLTGANAGTLTNLLYSLEPVVQGGFAIAPNSSPLLENIPPGQYKVRVQAVCGSEQVSSLQDVQVRGNYVPFKAVLSQKRQALNGCNTGQASLLLTPGKAPFYIRIKTAPATYSGPVTFTTNASSFLIDNLVKGDYTVSVTDSCGSTESTQNVSIAELPILTSSQFPYFRYAPVGTECNTLYVQPLLIGDQSGPLSAYQSPGTPITYSISFNGGAKTVYKPIANLNENYDTIQIPNGQSFKDIYFKNVTYFIKPPCGSEISINNMLEAPYINLSISPNCRTSFDASFYLAGRSSLICYPVYTSFKNNNTGFTKIDTILSQSGASGRVVKDLPYGSYTVTSMTRDGYLLHNMSNWTINSPAENPYSISISPYFGEYGNDGAIIFTINKSSGLFTRGTQIQLVSPGEYTYSEVVTGDLGLYNYYTVSRTTSTPSRYFYPGTYLFRVTDTCGSYELPVTVQEANVYRYNWNIEQQETCAGLKLTVTGSAIYNNSPVKLYTKILSGPSGYDGSVVPITSSLLLPTSGEYKIGVSGTPSDVFDFSKPLNQGLGNGVNVKSIIYGYKPLAIDVNHTQGWVCPGGADNDGNISAVAINGRITSPGNYTYKLAAVGNGINGPYLSVNTTGRFSTATSGGAYTLVKNQNYDIRVEDGCGAGVVQTIKVLDLGVTQIVTSDKQQYCEGDIIKLNTFNPFVPNVQYNWSGPDNFSSTQQSPTLPAKLSASGIYRVTITGLCSTPIMGELNVRVAPTVITCYSAVTDTSVNPYVYGLLGNWKQAKSYINYSARSGNNNDIRNDGVFTNYTPFWKWINGGLQLGDYLVAGGWVWTSESTLFNKKGFELENKDPLNRFNAGLYGYDNSLPIAVVQNSHYREAAFEGFEDYNFGSNECDIACTTARSFDFSSYKSQLDSIERHSGKYSLRVDAGKAAGMVVPVVSNDNNSFSFTTTTGTNSCTGNNALLRSIRLGTDALLPSFSPISGKDILISVWAKEAERCNCTGYMKNQIGIVVTQPSGATTVIAKPVGPIIDGWQRYEQVVNLPAAATKVSFSFEATGSTAVFFDDLRIHPYNAIMKSFVYNPVNLRLVAELDENNYATFYEYDDDGVLIRLKKETEKGIQTIQETRNALLKD